ncbi:MAG: efflux RND transporter periplasmic adaptor subunit [Christensenellales bacterium]|jgi:hypothetical protein
MAKIHRILSIVCVVACIGVCAAFLLPEKHVEVETELSHYRNMIIEERLTGLLERENAFLALPSSAGVVGDVYVKAGQKVLMGDPLFRMESSLLEAELASLNGQIALAEAVFAESKDYAALSLQRDALIERIAGCVVRAPSDGEVISVSVQGGGMAQGGVLIGSGGYSIRAAVSDIYADRINVGQKVSLKRGDSEGSGFISSFGASAASPGTFEAVATPEHFPFELPLGIQVEVNIITKEYTKVCVPISALLQGEDAVMCIIDGVAVKSPLELHDQDAHYIAVDGLPSGVEVITSPEGIKEGDRVISRLVSGVGTGGE